MKMPTAFIVSYVVFALAAILFQRSLLYFPDSSRPDIMSSSVSDMEVVTLHTADGIALNAWYKDAAEHHPTLVLFHGNGGHIGYRDDKMRYLLDQGYGMLAFDYRGYGGNAGKPSKDGLLKDAEASVTFLTNRGISLEDIIFYGESLGVGIAVETAVKHPPRAFILESPYTKISDVAASSYWFFPFARYAILDDYNAIDHIGTLSAPILMLHGRQDKIIPLKFGQKLFDKANEPKTLWISDDAGHNNLMRREALDQVKQFVDGLTAQSSSTNDAPDADATH